MNLVSKIRTILTLTFIYQNSNDEHHRYPDRYSNNERDVHVQRKAGVVVVVVAVDGGGGGNGDGVGGSVNVQAGGVVNHFANPSNASKHGLHGDKGAKRGVFGCRTSPRLIDWTKSFRVILRLRVAFS